MYDLMCPLRNSTIETIDLSKFERLNRPRHLFFYIIEALLKSTSMLMIMIFRVPTPSRRPSLINRLLISPIIC